LTSHSEKLNEVAARSEISSLLKWINNRKTPQEQVCHEQEAAGTLVVKQVLWNKRLPSPYSKFEKRKTRKIAAWTNYNQFGGKFYGERK